VGTNFPESLVRMVEDFAVEKHYFTIYNNHRLEMSCCFFCGGLELIRDVKLEDGEKTYVEVVDEGLCRMCLSVRAQQPDLFRWLLKIISYHMLRYHSDDMTREPEKPLSNLIIT
jgi:hypothetical protein